MVEVNETRKRGSLHANTRRAFKAPHVELIIIGAIKYHNQPRNKSMSFFLFSVINVES